MQAQISAIAYVCVAVCIAYFLTRSTADERWYRNGFLFWFGSVAVLFLFMNTKEFALLALAALLLFSIPRPIEQKLPFLMLIFFCVPAAVSAPIPFPGINYLIAANFQILIGTLIAAPALIGGQRSNGGWSKRFLLAYFVVIILLMFRVLPFTATIRFAVEVILGTLLIYLFIVRFADSERVIEQSMAAIYTAAVVLACIALMTQIKHWNFYSLVDTVGSAYEVRYGFLRTNTTINSVLLGFVEAIGLVLLLRHREISGRFQKFGWLIAFLLAMGYAASLSRGAWLSGIVIFAAYFFLKSRLSSSIIVILGISCVAFLAFMVFSGDGFSENLDPFQTFEYRRQLYVASWEQFQSAPFFGNPFYLDSGRFDHLVQGQGIIDIVSVYLQIVLQFGMVGLLFFVGPFLISLGGVLKIRSKELSLQSRTLISALGAFILGYLTLIFTVSDVSLITDFGVILLALATAAVAGVNSSFAEKRNVQSHPLRQSYPNGL